MADVKESNQLFMCCESQPIAHGRVHSKGAGAPDGADPLRMGRQEHRMGGAGGGQIIASGTPEQVAKNSASFTGKYLAPLLLPKKEKKRA